MPTDENVPMAVVAVAARVLTSRLQTGLFVVVVGLLSTNLFRIVLFNQSFLERQCTSSWMSQLVSTRTLRPARVCDAYCHESHILPYLFAHLDDTPLALVCTLSSNIQNTIPADQ